MEGKAVGRTGHRIWRWATRKGDYGDIKDTGKKAAAR